MLISMTKTVKRSALLCHCEQHAHKAQAWIHVLSQWIRLVADCTHDHDNITAAADQFRQKLAALCGFI